MPADLTPAELVVLGLLAERPRHGYDIEKTVEERGIREWTDLAFSSIYYLIGRLERAGLIEVVEGVTAQEGRRVRKTYAPTAAGLEAARKATREALTDLTPTRSPVLVGLANVPLLPPEEVLEALRTRADELDRQLVRLESHPRAAGPHPPFVAAIFDYTTAALRTERDWARQTLIALEMRKCRRPT